MSQSLAHPSSLGSAVEAPSDAAPRRAASHRLDIQGMRALAVGVVVLGHAGFSMFSGGFVGVDVFFVLSGFLITDLLLREHERTGGISLRNFWARRARRLLPASALVLVATVFLAVWILPATQWKPVSTDVLWSSLFAANWRFAQQQTDYFDQERMTSPVQHYWSLGVEEQFYVVWPLLVVSLAAIALWVIRQRTSTAGHVHRVESPATVRCAIAAVALLLSIVTFGYCVLLTETNQPYAYFGTPSRAWQLGLGALLAAVAPWVAPRLGPVTRNGLAVLGLAAFGWSVFALTEGSTSWAYPGAVAMAPTVASLLLIAAGLGGTSLIGRALAVKPLTKIGDWSYSLYLWHFPILILGIELLAPAGWLTRSGLIALAVAASWLTYELVENPIRSHPNLVKRPAISLALGGILVATGVLAAVSAPHTVASPTTITTESGEKTDLGEMLLDPMKGSVGVPGCTAISFDDYEPPACDDFGASGTNKRVIMIGDSHGGNMRVPLSAAAQAQGFGLTVWTKPACNVADVLTYDNARKAPNRPCLKFHKIVFARTIAADPDIVVLISANSAHKRVVSASGDVLTPEASRAEIIKGWRATIEHFTSRGIRVVVLEDWPAAGKTPPAECLLETGSVQQCVIKRSQTEPIEREAVKGLTGVRLVRLDKGWCNEVRCLPAVDGLLVYRDTNHLTAQFAQTLTPLLEREVLGKASNSPE